MFMFINIYIELAKISKLNIPAIQNKYLCKKIYGWARLPVSRCQWPAHSNGASEPACEGAGTGAWLSTSFDLCIALTVSLCTGQLVLFQ